MFHRLTFLLSFDIGKCCTEASVWMNYFWVIEFWHSNPVSKSCKSKDGEDKPKINPYLAEGVWGENLTSHSSVDLDKVISEESWLLEDFTVDLNLLWIWFCVHCFIWVNKSSSKDRSSGGTCCHIEKIFHSYLSWFIWIYWDFKILRLSVCKGISFHIFEHNCW